MGPPGMKTYSCITLAAALLLGTVGCEDAPSTAARPPPTPAKAAPAPAQAAAPAAPSPTETVAPIYVYAYNPTGKRDPFRPPEREERALDQINEVCTEPLCQFDLEQLTLVAVVTGGPNPLGMVEDPEKRGFIIKRNARMGKRGGKVSAIRRDEITVTEFWTGPDGKVVPNASTLKLQPDEERAKALNFLTGLPF